MIDKNLKFRLNLMTIWNLSLVTKLKREILIKSMVIIINQHSNFLISLITNYLIMTIKSNQCWTYLCFRWTKTRIQFKIIILFNLKIMFYMLYSKISRKWYMTVIWIYKITCLTKSWIYQIMSKLVNNYKPKLN